MLAKNKRGVFGLDLVQQAGIAFVVLAIVLSVGATLVAENRSDAVTDTAGCNSTHVTDCGYDYNASTQGLKAIDKLASKQVLFATVIILVLIIGVVMILRRK